MNSITTAAATPKGTRPRRPLIAAPSLTEGPTLFTAKEACAVLNIGTTKLNNLANDGLIKRVHLGHHCARFTRASIVELLARLDSGEFAEVPRKPAPAVEAAPAAPVKRGPGRPRKQQPAQA